MLRRVGKKSLSLDFGEGHREGSGFERGLFDH